MSATIDPQRLALAREYARARRSDRLAATLTDLLSEVLADRDRLAADCDRLRLQRNTYRLQAGRSALLLSEWLAARPDTTTLDDLGARTVAHLNGGQS